jgi:hypothetical protein
MLCKAVMDVARSSPQGRNSSGRRLHEFLALAVDVRALERVPPGALLGFLDVGTGFVVVPALLSISAVADNGYAAFACAARAGAPFAQSGSLQLPALSPTLEGRCASHTSLISTESSPRRICNKALSENPFIFWAPNTNSCRQLVSASTPRCFLKARDFG